MIVVLDTNIFVSFLLTRGETISSIFTSWRQKKFTVAANDEMIAELRQVIERLVVKNAVNESGAQSFLRRIKKEVKRIPSTSLVKKSPDLSDNRFLACSLDSKSDYLVTGDRKHLLILKHIGKTKIISPQQFVKTLKTSSLP